MCYNFRQSKEEWQTKAFMKITKFRKKIQLTNDGSLQFFFAGTGGAFNKTHFQNNLIVIKGKDHVLIDCGSLCPYALKTFNTNLTEIRAFLPTHSHSDHIGGLEEVAFLNFYITKQKPEMVITDQYKKILWEDSLKGALSYGEEKNPGVLFTFDDYFSQIRPVELKGTPRPVYEANVGSINLKLIRTRHVQCPGADWDNIFYSVGVLIDNRVFFSGDTKFDPSLLNWVEKTFTPEWIFHECIFAKSSVHSSYEELSTLPLELKKKMLLCHYSENYRDFSPKKDGFAGFAERGLYYTF